MTLHYFHMISQPCGATCISDSQVRKYLFMKFSNDIFQVTQTKKTGVKPEFSRTVVIQNTSHKNQSLMPSYAGAILWGKYSKTKNCELQKL